MALANASVSLSITLNLTTGNYKFVDTTPDYVANGVAIADVRGEIEITDPTGDVRNFPGVGTPDINGGVSLENTVITLDLVDGKPIPGGYTVRYKVTDDSTSEEVTITNTFTYGYVSPTVSVTMSVDVVAPELTSTDSTNYAVGSVSPTSITRLNEIYYPPALGIAAINGSNVVLSTATFYTQTHTGKVTADLEYDFTGYSVIDQVIGSKEIYVDATTLCDLFCCLDKLATKIANAKGVNVKVFNENTEKLVQAAPYLELIRQAYECGEQDKVSGYTATVREITECTDGCECEDGAPTPVVGLGGAAGTVTIVSAGNGITVSSAATGSNEITYTVNVEPILLAKINASYNSVVDAGSGVSVVVDMVGDTKTYTISSTQNAFNSGLSALVTIDFNPGNIATITKSEQIVGDLFQAATYEAENDASYAAWIVTPNSWKVSDFYDTATAFKPTVQIIKVEKNGAVIPTSSLLDVEVFDFITTAGSEEFRFRFKDPTGVIVTPGVIQNRQIDKVYLTIQINN